MKALNIVGQRKIYIFVTNLDDRFNHSFSLYDNKIRGFPHHYETALTSRRNKYIISDLPTLLF